MGKELWGLKPEILLVLVGLGLVLRFEGGLLGRLGLGDLLLRLGLGSALDGVAGLEISTLGN